MQENLPNADDLYAEFTNSHVDKPSIIPAQQQELQDADALYNEFSGEKYNNVMFGGIGHVVKSYGDVLADKVVEGAYQNATSPGMYILKSIPKMIPDTISAFAESSKSLVGAASYPFLPEQQQKDLEEMNIVGHTPIKDSLVKQSREEGRDLTTDELKQIFSEGAISPILPYIGTAFAFIDPLMPFVDAAQETAIKEGVQPGNVALAMTGLTVLGVAANGGIKGKMADATANHFLSREAVFNGEEPPSLAEIKVAHNASVLVADRPDIHTIAERIAPETVSKYRELETKRDTLRSDISDMKSDQVKKAQDAYSAEIIELQSKVDEAKARGKTSAYEDILNKKIAERDAAVEAAKGLETPEIADLRKQLQETDYQMRDLAPELSRAYREADAQIPKEDVVAEAAKPLEIAEEKVSIESKQAEVAQQRQAITDDFTRKWVEAGHNAEEANAFGGYVALRFEELSRRLGGRKSALELYNERSADVVAGKERKVAPQELMQTTKGKIRRATDDAKALITRFKRSDFSTMVHETGHEWLDDLLRDAVDDMATAALKRDAQIVRDWLKAEGELTTRQHEKFARSFERYFMEGVAPTKEMAGVFAQFKQWMMAIYKWIDEKRYPINDDIRDVFHRFVTEKPERTIIAPEKEGGRMSAAIHEADAVETPPARAAEAIETIRREADETAKLDPEIADAIATSPIGGKPDKIREDRGFVKESKPKFGEVGASSETQKISIGRDTISREGIGDKEKTPTPYETLPTPESDYVDKAGNIRLDNLNAPEDLKQALRDLAEQDKNFIGAREGVITDFQRRQMADSLGLSEKNFQPKKPDGVSTSVWAEAVQKFAFQTVQAAQKSAKKFAESGSIEDAAAMTEANSRALMVTRYFSNITAESGRTQRVFNKKDVSFTKDAAALIEELQKANQGKDLFQMQEMAKNLSEMDTQQKAAKFLNASVKPSFLDMIIEWRQISMLSGLRTHIKNMLGNTIVLTNSIVESAVASGVSSILRSKEGVNINEAKAKVFGVFQSRHDAMLAFSDIIKNGGTFDGTTKIDTPREGSIPGKFGKTTRVVFRALNAEDAFFKTLAHREELNTLAYRQANKEGLEGTAFEARVAEIYNNPTDAIMKQAQRGESVISSDFLKIYRDAEKIAREEGLSGFEFENRKKELISKGLEEHLKLYAQKQTFTDPLGPMGKWLSSGVNRFKILRIVFPFVHTPIKLVQYAIERTPLGLVSREIRENLLGKNGEIARDTTIAKIALGTSLSTYIAMNVMEDNVTGGGPENPAEKRVWLQTHKPYSIKTGDFWVSYAWAEPFATIMGITADAMEIAKYSDEKDQEDITRLGALIITSIVKNLGNKTFLQGMSDTSLALGRPEQYGDNYGRQFLSSLVPGILAQGTQINDPLVREAKDAISVLKSRIPGLSSSLFPKVDVFGKPIRKSEGIGPDFISPIYVEKTKSDPVAEKLNELHRGIAPVSRKINGVELTDAQYYQYATIAGEITHRMLTRLVQKRSFNSKSKDEQLKDIKDVVDTAREAARKTIKLDPKNSNIRKGIIP